MFIKSWLRQLGCPIWYFKTAASIIRYWQYLSSDGQIKCVFPAILNEKLSKELSNSVRLKSTTDVYYFKFLYFWTNNIGVGTCYTRALKIEANQFCCFSHPLPPLATLNFLSMVIHVPNVFMKIFAVDSTLKTSIFCFCPLEFRKIGKSFMKQSNNKIKIKIERRDKQLHVYNLTLCVCTFIMWVNMKLSQSFPFNPLCLFNPLPCFKLFSWSAPGL